MRRNGADAVLTPAEGEPWHKALQEGHEFDCVFDCVGDSETVAQCKEVLKKGAAWVNAVRPIGDGSGGLGKVLVGVWRRANEAFASVRFLDAVHRPDARQDLQVRACGPGPGMWCNG